MEPRFTSCMIRNMRNSCKQRCRIRRRGEWNWCSIGDNKQTVTEFNALKEEGDATDLESAPIATPTSPNMSSPVTSKGVVDSLEQESSGESTGGSTTEDGP